ncbi:glycosyltransferase family 2 protein [Ornithinibacillus californiensis]|uniref:glycosyltransferase family 2 protein n=1 Tax=Ornithinibacillus californiensis TaxID=161536 RepID=UPI00069FBAD3|nr:glycosyltransferase [Ornithinibacillus californiensis]
MKPEISIIVPIYNLEYLLPKCINSILAQSYSNFELILVNDGSTDNSGEICDEYAKEDNRIVVIHKENGGVASCRNTGIEIARGNYIGFVDNDDYINKYMFELLFENAIKFSSEIVVCDYQRIPEEEYIDTEKYNQDYDVQHYNNLEALNEIYYQNAGTFIYPWNKLYRKEVFNNVVYEHGNPFDDESVVHKILFKSTKITYIKLPLYYYVTRKGSMVNSNFSTKKFGRVYALKDREEFFRKNKLMDLQQKALKHYMEIFFWYYFKGTGIEGAKKELRELKRTFDQSLIHLLKLREISFKHKIMLFVFRVSPTLFGFIKNVGDRSKARQQSV